MRWSPGATSPRVGQAPLGFVPVRREMNALPAY